MTVTMEIAFGYIGRIHAGSSRCFSFSRCSPRSWCPAWRTRPFHLRRDRGNGTEGIQALDTLRRVLGLPPLAARVPHEGPAQTSTAAAPDDLGQLATAEAPAVEEPMSRAAFGAVKPKGKAEDGGAHVALESGTGATCTVSSRRDPGNTA